MNSTNASGDTTLVSNRTYHNLNTIVQFVLPSISVFYFVSSAIWNLPNTESIMGSLAFLMLILGVFIRMAKKIYYGNDSRFNGYIDIQQTPDGRKLYSLELNSDPEEIDKMSSVTFKVGSVRSLEDV